jgi:hypothetical protein
MWPVASQAGLACTVHLKTPSYRESFAMIRRYWWALSALLLAAGCSGDAELKPPAPEDNVQVSPPGPRPSSGQDAIDLPLTADQLTEIKKLPEDDQKLAIAQKICPVSEEHLGDMGKPIKVTAGGETFFICCDGCKKDLEDEAKLKTYLAKLPKK